MLLSAIKKIRDPYRLWYEFLKRSEKYKKCCEAMRAGMSLPWTEENAKLMDTFYSWGDVFVNPYLKSYNKFKSNRQPITRKAVVDYKAEFRDRATNIIQNFENENDREITVPELINELGREFKDQMIVLIIDPTRGVDEDILAKVQEALDEKRSHPRTSGLPLIECINNHLSTDQFSMNYLKKCLMVFDLKNSGKTYREIAQALGSPTYGDVKRNLIRCKAAAIELIRNAEQGTFPGEYRASDEDALEHHVIV